MKQSEQINELAAAMCRLQAQLPKVHKDSKSYNNTYASLKKVLEVVYPLATAEGLSTTHFADSTAEGKPALTSTLMHTSGQFQQGTVELPAKVVAKANDAQQIGGGMSYMIRYQDGAIYGVIIEDDDAECLTDKPKKAKSDAVPASALYSRDECLREIGEAPVVAAVKNIHAAHKAKATSEGWLDDLRDAAIAANQRITEGAA